MTDLDSSLSPDARYIPFPSFRDWPRTALAASARELERGNYKTGPNHMREAGGKVFAFAPVTDTPREMHRLLEELRGDSFQEANAIEQAAYAHYCFVRLHPFADGNSRVARALASAFLNKKLSVPLLILADQRDEYLEALKAADNGHMEHFSDFIQRRAVDTLDLVLDRLKSPLPPSAEKSIAAMTLGNGTSAENAVVVPGLTLADAVIAASEPLVRLAYAALFKACENLDLPSSISGLVRLLPPVTKAAPGDQSGGFLLDKARILLRFSKAFPPELEATIDEKILLRIGEGGETIGLQGLSWKESVFETSPDQVSSAPGSFLDLKLASWADRVLRKALHELNNKVHRRLADECS